MLNDQSWVIGLLSLNITLSLVVLRMAWRIHKLKHQLNSWNNTLTNVEQQLASTLTRSPTLVSTYGERLQMLRSTCQEWLSMLNRIQQVFILIRFLVAVVKRYV